MFSNDLPEVSNYEADTVENTEEWLENNVNFHKAAAQKVEEVVAMRGEVNYFCRKMTLTNGRLIFPTTKVDDVLSLIMQSA